MKIDQYFDNVIIGLHYIKSQQVIKGKKLKLIMVTDIMNITWTAEVQILNEDMILAVLIVI